MITQFKGQHAFLSNFWESRVVCDMGISYPTVEHGFQAAKSLDLATRQALAKAKTPGSAKRMGRSITPLRDGWNDIRTQIMLDFLRQKFNHAGLKQLLLATGDAELIEGNTWGDQTWGVYKGKGLNLLGKLLMQVRSELREQQ